MLFSRDVFKAQGHRMIISQLMGKSTYNQEDANQKLMSLLIA